MHLGLLTFIKPTVFLLVLFFLLLLGYILFTFVSPPPWPSTFHELCKVSVVADSVDAIIK